MTPPEAVLACGGARDEATLELQQLQAGWVVAGLLAGRVEEAALKLNQPTLGEEAALNYIGSRSFRYIRLQGLGCPRRNYLMASL